MCVCVCVFMETLFLWGSSMHLYLCVCVCVCVFVCVCTMRSISHIPLIHAHSFSGRFYLKGLAEPVHTSVLVTAPHSVLKCLKSFSFSSICSTFEDSDSLAISKYCSTNIP